MELNTFYHLLIIKPPMDLRNRQSRHSKVVLVSFKVQWRIDWFIFSSSTGSLLSQPQESPLLNFWWGGGSAVTSFWCIAVSSKLKKGESIKPPRKVELGDEVYACNYQGYKKWLPARVSKFTETVSYQVETESGVTLCCHIDQLRSHYASPVQNEQAILPKRG